MAEQRKLIRAALAKQLQDNIAGIDVFRSRKKAMSARQNGVIIFTPKDTPQEDSYDSAPREYVRDLSIRVEVFVHEGDVESDCEDAVDDLCHKIETAIGLDDSLNGTCSDLILVDTETDVNDEGETLVGIATILLTAQYRTVLEGDSADLENFDTVGVSWNLDNNQGAAERAQDLVGGIYQGT